jgi:hypothetical protein
VAVIAVRTQALLHHIGNEDSDEHRVIGWRATPTNENHQRIQTSQILHAHPSNETNQNQPTPYIRTETSGVKRKRKRKRKRIAWDSFAKRKARNLVLPILLMIP